MLSCCFRLVPSDDHGHYSVAVASRSGSVVAGVVAGVDAVCFVGRSAQAFVMLMLMVV